MQPSVASISLLRCNCKQRVPSVTATAATSVNVNARRETPKPFFMTPCGISRSECAHQLACPFEGNPNDCCLMNPRSGLGIWWCLTGLSTASSKSLTCRISLPLCLVVAGGASAVRKKKGVALLLESERSKRGRGNAITRGSPRPEL
jgi:hypothetical protein